MQGYEDLVDKIYEAATEPSIWPGLLESIGLQVDAPAAVLATWGTDQWLSMRNSPILDNSGLDTYVRSDAPNRSITTPRLIAANRPCFISNQELFTDEEYSSDPSITELAGPAGFYNGAATAIHIPTGELVVAQFMRHTGRNAFERKALDILDSFRPHLARASLLAARWRMERLRAAAEALAMIGLPAAVLDSYGRVLMANSLIQGMTKYIVWRSQNRLALTDQTATAQLQQAIADILNPAAPTVRSFPAKGKSLDEPVVIHVIPATGRARDLFEGGFGILVVTPVSKPHSPDIALIQGLFDLTPAEARVAQDIVRGLTVNEMASRYGTMKETVRSQVKSLLSKIGVRRQVEAAAQLSALPRIRRSDD